MQHPTFETRFTFGPPIHLREKPTSHSKLAIFPQPKASITLYPIPSSHSPQDKSISAKKNESGDGGAKIGKGLLRDCHESTVACLSELL